ncbi:MAG: 4-(cytidine 5'-diphospho)-2-C-methyl-D-erythritol kinase [Acidobacteriota bacterium]
MPNWIRVRSFAKINWTLDVLFKREDDYHEIRTIYQTISLHDRIRLTRTRGQIEILTDNPSAPSDESNLAYKAASLLRERTGARDGARIEIEKRIPVAAGLGGGSSNAASALLGLCKLWRVEISESDLVEIAAGLGSDVPFFLLGGTALGVGRGEEVYPLEETRAENLLIANPGVKVSTADAYRKLSRLTRQKAARIIPLSLIAAKGIHELPLAARNDFEQIVSAAHPEIAQLRRRLLELGASSAVMSGSGATMVGVFDNTKSCERAQAALSLSGLWAERASAISREQYRNTLFESESS